MKITSKLALKQVRLNPGRSIGAISAIGISTALLITISCFASSGFAMLQNFLGEDFGDYGGFYSSLIVIPAIILGFLIFFIAVSVISNIFQVSTNQRMKEFGTLKCVGGTSKQVKETILYESIWLSLVGIPIGIILGILVGYLGVHICGNYVERMNELAKSIMMRSFELSLKFEVSRIYLILAVLFSFFTVLYAAYKPVKKASKISAIECIKGMGEINIPEKGAKQTSLFKSAEWKLADLNMKRKKYAYKPTIRSLTIGMVLILSGTSIITQVRGIEKFMNNGSKDIMVHYSSNHYDEYSKEAGCEVERYSKPIYRKDTEEITALLSDFAACEVVGVGANSSMYKAVIDEAFLAEDMKLYEDKVLESNEISVELVVFDQKTYEKVCEVAGVSVGSNILINYFAYNDNGCTKAIIPYLENLKNVTIKDGIDEINLEISGVVYKEQLSPHAFGIVHEPLRIIVPDAELRFFDWFCHPADEIAYTDYARKIMNQYFPMQTEDPYVLEGFTVQVSREDTMIKVINIAVVIANFVIYGFVILLLGIGFISVISTISTNIMVREREFAVLKSIGMTSGVLQKMLLNESLLCTVWVVITGVPFGILISYIVNLSIRKIAPVRYEIPWMLIMSSSILIIGAVSVITFICLRKIKNQNIIEVIHKE